MDRVEARETGGGTPMIGDLVVSPVTASPDELTG